MTFITLYKSDPYLEGEISIPGSKSLSNRLLILSKLYKNSQMGHLSSSEDTLALERALSQLEKSPACCLDVGPCGTAMRFLSAYLACQEGFEVELSGSNQMHQRPIGPLIEALKKMGASIIYLQNEGYPPLKIIGKKLSGGLIKLEASISSQFVSALMMIGPLLEDGLEMHLEGKITSWPYIEMTYKLMQNIGASLKISKNKIFIGPGVSSYKKEFFVESDWSCAAYYYLLASLSKDCNLLLSCYEKNSLQGDSKLREIYKKYFGISTFFTKDGKIQLSKDLSFVLPKSLTLDLNDTPDLAQSILVNAAAHFLKCKITGLETLNIKETNRLEALKNELQKIGVRSLITKESFEIIDFGEKKEEIVVETYKGHRMAMSFAPLGLLYPVKIKDPQVVKKSYPNFWQDLQMLGFELN